jgi:hypothetical protein
MPDVKCYSFVFGTNVDMTSLSVLLNVFKSLLVEFYIDFESSSSIAIDAVGKASEFYKTVLAFDLLLRILCVSIE